MVYDYVVKSSQEYSSSIIQWLEIFHESIG